MSLDSIFRLSVIVNMIDNLTGPMAVVNTSVDRTTSKIESLNQTFGSMTKTGVAMTAAGATITNALLAPVEATFGTSKALGELSSLGVRDLEALEGAAKKFSDTWAGTTKADFITAAYDIKSGIASLNDEAVATYTEFSGITAKATKSNIAEMTSLFATGYGIYKDYYKNLSDMEFGEMFSAGIAKSVQQFKTDGSKMAQSIQTLGGSATSANVPLEEQLSILGMLQATMGGSEAGTKYKAFLRSAAKAGDDLGLSFTDANNQLLSMPEILEKLRGKFGDTMDAAEKMELQKAFGTDEAVALVDLLYNKTGDLESNMALLNTEMGKGIDVATGMANAINATDGESYEVLSQKIGNMKEQIGGLLLPTVNEFVDKAGSVVEKVSSWVSENEELASGIMHTVLTVGIVLSVLGVLMAVIGGVGVAIVKTTTVVTSMWSAVKMLKGGFETLQIVTMYAGDGLKVFGARMIASAASAKSFVIGLAGMAKQAIVTGVQALPGLIASVWSFTAALLANPITWVVIGIIALIAAIILLQQNWDSVTAWMSNTWNGFVNGISTGWSNVKASFTSGIQGIKDSITNSYEWFRASGAKILTTFTEGIKSAISVPVEAVKGGLARIRKLLPFSDAKEGPLSTLTLSGRRVFETITSGMVQTQNLPAKVTEKAFSAVNLGMQGASDEEKIQGKNPISKSEIKRVSLKELSKESTFKSSTTKEKGKTTIIQKLEVKVDISKLKDLPALLKLVKEIEDYNNGNGDSGDGATPELEFA